MWSVPESSEPSVELPTSPAPPWPARVRAALWWHRADDGARALGRSGPAGPQWPLTVGMVVDYLSSPVGPYREVLASPVLRRAALPTLAVPFIAVDSATSAHGGRVHWDLPKTLATFTGDVLASAAAQGPGWHVHTRVRALGPVLPIAGAIRFAQPVDDGGLGLTTVRLLGWFRAARVTVDSAGPTLAGPTLAGPTLAGPTLGGAGHGGWLRPGTHRGVVITAGRMRTGPQHRRR